MPKSTTKALPYSTIHADLFKDVRFMIEATDHEQQALWEKHHYKPSKHSSHIKTWEEIAMGHGIQIGSVDHRPIAVSIRYAILNDKKVMFYHGMSQLVDYQMIEDWIQMYSLDTIKSNDGRWAHCDADNFHLCLHFVNASA